MLQTSRTIAWPVAALLLLLTGCRRDGGEGEGKGTSRYMLPQAEGVYLGMSWTHLQQVRPGVRAREGLLTESGAEGTNEYLFQQGSGRPELGSTAGRLAIVRMRPRLDDRDTASLGRAVREIESRWTAIVGVPGVPSVREVPAQGAIPALSYRVLTWTPAHAKLTIEYSTGQVPPGGPDLLVTVQAPGS